jgi:hypothetical protein
MGREEKRFFSTFFMPPCLTKDKEMPSVALLTGRLLFEVDIPCQSKDIFLLCILYYCSENDR